MFSVYLPATGGLIKLARLHWEVMMLSEIMVLIAENQDAAVSTIPNAPPEPIRLVPAIMAISPNIAFWPMAPPPPGKRLPNTENRLGAIGTHAGVRP
jgi:hypothetical protein